MKNQPNREMRYYGVHACKALWQKRPQDIVRVYIDSANIKFFSPLLKWCADQKKVYRVIPFDELNKVSDSVHHEGICIVAKELPLIAPEHLMTCLRNDSPTALLYLDGVQNPHNLGSIMRTSAHFGIPFILGETGALPALTPSAYRIAKGAAEIVRLAPLDRPQQLLSRLKKMGFSLIATSSHGGSSLHQFSFPRRSVIILGSESFGVGQSLQKLADHQVQIQGSGAMESLNVSVAAALFLGEYYRQQEAKISCFNLDRGLSSPKA